jgi:hypothetical protein
LYFSAAAKPDADSRHDCPTVPKHSRPTKTYSQHNLYALRCQSAQHYWYAILRTAARRRKKTRLWRTQRMGLRSYKPNFPYKYNSTAPNNCQVEIKIHMSDIIPSQTDKEGHISRSESAFSAFQFHPNFERRNQNAFGKFHLRYFVCFPCQTSDFKGIFGVFLKPCNGTASLCKYNLPAPAYLIAVATIFSSGKPCASCTISTPFFLHMYKMNKSDFFS